MMSHVGGADTTLGTQNNQTVETMGVYSNMLEKSGTNNMTQTPARIKTDLVAANRMTR